MIQNIQIKKEIIKTFLKNVNRPIEEISSVIFKHLSTTYFRNEKMIYNNNTQCIIVRRDHDKYKIKLDSSNIVDANVGDLKRVNPISKNMLYGFLIENTTQTIFGRVLKLNVYNEFTEHENDKDPQVQVQVKTNVDIKDVNARKNKSVQKPISDFIDMQPCRDNEIGKIMANRIEMFELFLFYGRFHDFLSFNLNVSSFEIFMDNINTLHFKFMICKELLKVIRVDKNEEYMNDLITISLEMNYEMMQQIKKDKGFVKDDKLDWETSLIDKSNYMQIVKNFLIFVANINNIGNLLINNAIFENYFQVLLKFLTDIVVHCSSFKLYYDKTIEKIRKIERERYELNARCRKIDLDKSKNENSEKIKKELNAKLLEMDKFLLKNRLKPRIGRYLNNNYYFMSSDIYFIENQNVYLVEKSTRNVFIKSFKGKKEATSIVNFCKQVCDLD